MEKRERRGWEGEMGGVGAWGRDGRGRQRVKGKGGEGKRRVEGRGRGYKGQGKGMRKVEGREG